MTDVFISYAKTDYDIAKSLADDLAKAGYVIWWDTKLAAGESFKDVIVKELNRAKAVIVIWSEQSVQSRWVYSEASRAASQHKLITLRTRDLVADEIPMPYDALHTDFVDDRERIRQILEQRNILNEREPVSASAKVLPDGDAAEQLLFAEVEKTNSQDGYEFYLQRYPTGRYSEVVRFRLRQLAQSAGAGGQASEALATRSVPQPAPEPEGSYRVRVGAADTELRLAPGTTFRDADYLPEMVVIPPGQYTAGAPADVDMRESQPEKKVAIRRPFAVGRYPVTFEEWDAYLAQAGLDPEDFSDKGWGRDTRPAICVSWEEAKCYVAWLAEATGQQYRLLSEAEWEYVARAGTTTPYWWGSSADEARLNYKRAYSERTTPVDKFEPNAFGVFDMLGNVKEWVEDSWSEDLSSMSGDATAWVSADAGELHRRVVRGGSWLDNERNVRCYARTWSNLDNKVFNVGFRVARNL